MRELTLNELKFVSGGNANSNYEGGCRSAVRNGAYRGGQDGAVQGAIQGAITGAVADGVGAIPGALGGGALGGIVGSATGAYKAYRDSPACNSNSGGNKGNLGGDANAHSVNGQCHW